MLSWLFPVTCVRCGERSDFALCQACRASMSRVPRPVCLYCGTPVAGDQDDPYACGQCRPRPRTFSFARSALMRDATALALVHDFKYHRANYLAPAFAACMAELWDETPALRACRDWRLVPVPVSPHHLRQRGYNQAAELAICLGHQLGLPLWDPLERISTGITSQTRLSAAERQRHAMKAYSVQPRFLGKSAPSPHLLLVDDVYTTGSTARACAHALRQVPGVEQVGVVTLLRAGSTPASRVRFL